jgi:DNA-3-methyladenine glycosylase
MLFLYCNELASYLANFRRPVRWITIKNMDDQLDTILSDSAVVVARRLLGCRLVRQLGDQSIVGRIVETEAYDQTDTASHSYRGVTPRTATLFGSPGHLYVYFTYGKHYCCNVVCGLTGQGAAVLIRALEPLKGQTIMAANRQARPNWPPGRLTNGPGKVCQAFGIDKTLNGHDLRQPPLQLCLEPALPAVCIRQTVRIGISTARDKPWRFYIRDNTYVSRPL